MLRSLAVALIALSLFGASTVHAQWDEVEIVATPLSEGIHMLQGRGGNLALSAGEDGVFLIDDQYAPLSDKILAAIAEIDSRPLSFVLNTHWHGDHTGGNEAMGAAGAFIVSHENVRRRMSEEQFGDFLQRRTPAAAAAALPVVTFNDEITFHLNGEEIHVFHVQNAHTDGDAVVHFRRANVIHSGDVVFHGLYPFIDVDSGGSVDGVIDATERILELCDDHTKIVPGHGPLINATGLRGYRDLLVEMRHRIEALIVEGLDVESAKARHPFSDWDDTLGQAWLSSDQMVDLFYRSLSADD